MSADSVEEASAARWSYLLSLAACTMTQPLTAAMESKIFEIGAHHIDAEVVVGAGHDSSLLPPHPEIISAMNQFFDIREAKDQTFRTPFIKFELPRGEK